MVFSILGKIEGFVEIADLGEAVARGRGRAGCMALRGIVVLRWRGGVELVIDAGERGQVETALDELEDRGVFVELAGDVAAPGPGRDDQHRNAQSHAIGVNLWGRDVIEAAAALVVGEEEGGTVPAL